MKTRSTTNKSQTNQKTVDIDFDDSIAEWNKNKRSMGNGHYKYICTVVTNKSETGLCAKVCYKDKDKCWIHRNK